MAGVLTFQQLEVGTMYQLSPSFRSDGCSAVGNAYSKQASGSKIFVKVTDKGRSDAEQSKAFKYEIYSENKVLIDGCGGCIKPSDLMVLVAPTKVTINSVVISEEKHQQIRAAISQTKYTTKIFDEWGFGEVFEKGTAVSLLFYGVPGTGKTLMAQAITDELGMDLKILNTADIETSEPGGAERAIKLHFDEAGRKYEQALQGNGKAQVLLFDECDSLLTDRNEVGVILAAQVNALLTELERYKGIVIFTTNRLGKLDPALERRITAKIEFEFPNPEMRAKIWQRMIPAKAPISDDVNWKELSEFPMTGGNIKNAVLNAARKAAFSELPTITRLCFLEAIEHELQGLQEFVSAYEQSTKLPRPMGRSGLQRGVGGLTVDRKVEIKKEKTKKTKTGGKRA